MGASTGARRWPRKALGNALALGFGVVLAVGVGEAAVRLADEDLPLALWNAMHNCNDVRASFANRRLQLTAFKPDTEAVCGANHYLWSHRTNSWGLRAPERERADILLVGDSMVYGQAVEAAETATVLLEDRLGSTVINAGHSGDGPVEYLARVPMLLDAYQPRIVVLFLYRNDFWDITTARSEEMVRRYVDEGIAPEAGPITRDVFFEGADEMAWLVAGPWRELRLATLLHYQIHKARDDRLAPWSDRRRRMPPELVSAYVARAIEQLAAACHARGARLILGVMPSSFPEGRPVNPAIARVEREAAELAMRLGLTPFDPTPAFRLPNGRPRPELYLPGDYHLSAEGHRVLAEELDALLRDLL